jgi:predicted PurR-regulated permease PerM
MERIENVIQISAGTIIKTILILILFWMIFILRDLVLIILMSIVIASAVEPAAQWLMKRKIPRLLAVIFVYLSLAIALICVIYFLVLPLLSESSDFLKNMPTYFNVDTVSNTIDQNKFLSSQPIVASLQNSINLEQIIGQVNGAITGLTNSAFNTVSSVFGGILSFLLMVVMSFYLSVERDGVGKFLKIVTPLKHEGYIIDLWRRSQRKIGLWMQGQIILAVIIGVLVYLGLMLLNVPNALLLASLAGAFEIIPLFGPILASIPAIAISFVSGGGFTAALLTAGLYLIVHQFENQLIYPLVVKKVVGVPPIVSIVALVAGFELAGFLGLILSVPIAAIFIEFFDDLERNKIEKIEKMKAGN